MRDSMNNQMADGLTSVGRSSVSLMNQVDELRWQPALTWTAGVSPFT